MRTPQAETLMVTCLPGAVSVVPDVCILGSPSRSMMWLREFALPGESHTPPKTRRKGWYHSIRSIMTGSMRAALKAGMAVAIIATPSTSAVTTAKVSGSVATMP